MNEYRNSTKWPAGPDVTEGGIIKPLVYNS